MSALLERTENVSRPISFQKLVLRIADQYGSDIATNWTERVLGHAAAIDEVALRAAIDKRSIKAITKVVNAVKLQQSLELVVQPYLRRAGQAAGYGSVQTLSTKGLSISFNAADPVIAQHAREQAGLLVQSIPEDTRRMIGEIVARGAEGLLTVVDQARVIRELVGLPPNWILAPLRLADELRDGQISAALSRRLSGAQKQQIRSRAARGTIDSDFIAEMTQKYSESLVNRRALTIARTESHEMANFGLTTSWQQALQSGQLPHTARRFWLVTPDSHLSPQHARIPFMNRNGRKINEPFFTTEGIKMNPPSRPNCRCSVGLGFAFRSTR